MPSSAPPPIPPCACRLNGCSRRCATSAPPPTRTNCVLRRRYSGRCGRKRPGWTGRKSQMHDLLIRGGSIVDGTGAPAYAGDVAVSAGRVAEIGKVSGSARRVIDAAGLLVAPGWVDIHTHYDGQASWDAYMTPSSWHGVTTAIMGNCGVGFAPAHAHQRQWMIELMEGVEDIPGAVLSAGVRWEWESFPEFLDSLASRPRVMDLGAQIPHGALRVFVRGERGAGREVATEADIAAMAALGRE